MLNARRAKISGSCKFLQRSTSRFAAGSGRYGATLGSAVIQKTNCDSEHNLCLQDSEHQLRLQLDDADGGVRADKDRRKCW